MRLFQEAYLDDKIDQIRPELKPFENKSPDRFLKKPKARSGIFTAIAFGIAALIFVISTEFGINFSVNKLLEQHSHTTGVNWARHIEARAPYIKGVVNWEPFTEEPRSPYVVEFIEMINGMLSVGNIYQIDVVKLDCMCGITMGALSRKDPDRPKTHLLTGWYNTADLGQQEESQNHTVPTNDKDFMRSRIHRSAPNRTSYGPRNLFGKYDNQFPIIPEIVQEIGDELRHDIILHSSEDANNPAKFSEVYHPVLLNGKLSYLLRIMVDLEAENIRFQGAMHKSAAIMLVLLLVAFVFPSLKFLRASKEQREANQQAHFLANNDMMTGVSNRNWVQNEAATILENCRKSNKNAAIFSFDIDKFKNVNDLYGHEAGDLVICSLARQLKEIVPKGGTIARLGGDEFVVIVEYVGDSNTDVTTLIDVPVSFKTAIKENTQIIESGISAGAVRFPHDGENLEELMRNADMALYAAKSASGRCVVAYDEQMSIEFDADLKLREEFKDALKKSQIIPFYQPVFNVATGRVIGLEALARWEHPSKGILTPYVFESLLREPEFEPVVGDLMRNKIMKDMKRWKASGVDFISVGLNIGESDLKNTGYALNIISELSKHDLQPKNLTLEVTETCIFGSNSGALIQQLELLRSAGCSISLDDFGTGYSSITHIKQLPCTTIKIDKSFVNNVVDDEADQSIIQSLLALGNKMGFKLILEGVEQKDQVDFLRSLGCDFMQGYYFSRPVPASKVPEVIEMLTDYSSKDVKFLVAAS